MGLWWEYSSHSTSPRWTYGNQNSGTLYRPKRGWVYSFRGSPDCSLGRMVHFGGYCDMHESTPSYNTDPVNTMIFFPPKDAGGPTCCPVPPAKSTNQFVPSRICPS
ncbi:hypothetical protein JB92DRAFT_1762584 [Gautieria morchelliformis]|nr:hypothetical protein JB92DRAFT_1762584 [Gautieria morchelliformis]